jgi:predicted helicase
VSNAGWVDGKAADGLRQCLVEDFANIHVFHLRGNQRTSGERSRREGGKIFGSGSRTPVAITLLVKNPNAAAHGQIRFHDIGDYLTREEKLERIARFGSIGGIECAGGWQTIIPDEHSDWLGKRNKSFEKFPPLGAKREVADFTIFENYSAGVKTNRDPWAFGSSDDAVSKNMTRMIKFYQESLDAPDRPDINDETKISWSWVLRERFQKGKSAAFRPDAIVQSLYRPFSPQWLYYDGFFNENRYLMTKIWPTGKERGRAIYITGPSAPSFSALLVEAVPCLDVMAKGQCFPRYLYEEAVQPREGELALGGAAEGGLVKRDAITDAGLAHFQAAYPGEAITKDDLFYYVYGLLHSPEYRERFADNLSKQLPRIPAVKQATDFWAFVDAGRRLGDLHCDYESVDPFPVTIAQGALELAHIPDPEKFYRVEKMKFGGKRPQQDKSTVIYNSNITMTGIPLEAYDYVVNGKPALEWVMERQCVKVDKASGIVNDANRYAIETVGDPAYPLKLFQRVITVSLETMKIVRSLPKLEID